MFLFQKNTSLKNIIFETHINNLSIIPVNIEAIKLEIQLNNEISREKILLSYFRENYEYLKNYYDYILIDTNPSLNITNTNAYAITKALCDNSIHLLRAIDMVFDVWSNLCQKMEIKNNIKAIVLSNFDHYKISKEGKGFNININDLSNGYKEFLDPVIYVNPQTSYAINQSKLDKVISDIAEQKLQDGLSVLPQNFNQLGKNVFCVYVAIGQKTSTSKSQSSNSKSQKM